MNPQIDKKKYQGSPIGVNKAAKRKINVRTRGGYDKPPCTRRALQVDRTVGRQGIVSKSSGEGTMKARGGGSDGAPVMGQWLAHTKASRGGVGYYGKYR